jgi:2-polyprenyl-6-methoxyphenol hydroxylase-like FAD-dependent oxidoreductase
MHLSTRIAWPEAAALLLGDSAHNVTPQLGQGCNSALEDTRLLSAALEAAAPEAAFAAAAASSGDTEAGAAAGTDAGAGAAPAAEAVAGAAARPAVAAALARYERRRLPQAHALQLIEEENAWVRRPAAPGREPLRMTYMRVAWACAAALLAAAHAMLAALPGPLAARAPQLSPSLFENVMATAAPYDALHWAVRAAPLVAAALLWGAVAAALAVVRTAVRALLMVAAGG